MKTAEQHNAALTGKADVSQMRKPAISQPICEHPNQQLIVSLERAYRDIDELRKKQALYDTYVELAAELWVMLRPDQTPEGEPEQLCDGIYNSVLELRAERDQLKVEIKAMREELVLARVDAIRARANTTQRSLGDGTDHRVYPYVELRALLPLAGHGRDPLQTRALNALANAGITSIHLLRVAIQTEQWRRYRVKNIGPKCAKVIMDALARLDRENEAPDANRTDYGQTEQR